MTLFNLLRVVFLLSLGLDLLVPNRVCHLVAGVSAVVLGVLVLLGQ